jgi:acyl-CoA thioester hydrolase
MDDAAPGCSLSDFPGTGGGEAAKGGLSGFLEGTRHHLPVRVYYADTDAAGMVYHSAYLDFAERGRTEMLRMFGFDHHRLQGMDGLVFAVRHLAIDYLQPARLDDLLDVRSRLVHMGGATLQLRQSLWREAAELARMAVRLGCVRVTGGVARIPVSVRDRLQNYLMKGTD